MILDTASQLCRAQMPRRSSDWKAEFTALRRATASIPAYLEHERLNADICPGQGTVVGRAAMGREVVADRRCVD